MTARYFLQEVPGLSSAEALLLKQAVGTKFSGDTKSNAYYDKLKQIAFNLRKSGQKVPDEKTAAEMVEYTDEEWLLKAGGSGATGSQQQQQSARAVLQSLLSVDTLDDEGLAANAPLVICRYCGTSDVAFDSLQTRSIDEGATIFFFCLNPTCLKQWTQAS